MHRNKEKIDELIERINEEASSKRNLECKKEKQGPRLSFSVANPLGFTKLFGYDYNRYLDDPVFYVEQTLRQYLWSWENIHDDSPIQEEIPVSFGSYPEYTFFGIEVRHTENGAPILQSDHPISREPNIKLLEPINFKTSGWMPKILKRCEELDEILRGRIKVTPTKLWSDGTNYSSLWFRGGLDIAIQLRGFDNFIEDTVERPEFVHSLMKFIIEQRILWYEKFYEYFGFQRGPISFGDDWLNVPFISPGIFEEFILPYYMELEKHHGGIGWIHSCGNQTALQCHMLKMKTLNTFEVSPWTDLEKTIMNLPEDKQLLFYVNPVDDFYFTPDKIEEKLRYISKTCSNRKYNIIACTLMPFDDDHMNIRYISQIRSWIEIAREVL